MRCEGGKWSRQAAGGRGRGRLRRDGRASSITGGLKLDLGSSPSFLPSDCISPSFQFRSRNFSFLIRASGIWIPHSDRLFCSNNFAGILGRVTFIKGVFPVELPQKRKIPFSPFPITRPTACRRNQINAGVVDRLPTFLPRESTAVFRRSARDLDFTRAETIASKKPRRICCWTGGRKEANKAITQP